ncbi:MAG: 3-phosphoshikimate 1-carboxyvinyltransferase [Pyrinomonadaceae bacterium]|nr:3-phosphoshikimate 1-carboxyvinyltransferase [Pyrinomonadaceae bacterium]
MKILPARRLEGQMELPGDKSISHRAAIIAALARGRPRISNFSTSADCASTLACLAQLGVRFKREANTIIIEGVGTESTMLLQAPPSALDCGNSGTTMRLLAGVLAGQPFASTLTGDESLRARPMRRIIEPLQLMGARISSEQDRAPLQIEGRPPLEPVSYALPLPSAQVKSCILLAGLNASGRTEVIESHAQTRDHTERMLRWFGINVKVETNKQDRTRITIEGGKPPLARDFSVPGDLSSAAFLIAAAALLPRSHLILQNVGVNPTRTQFLQTMRELGADIRVRNVRDVCNESVGDIEVRGTGALANSKKQTKFILRGTRVAGLIDELPMLAVIGTQVEGGLEVRDAGELRVKESDRIRATIENLRRMNAEVEEYDDGFAVGGRTVLRGALLDAKGDHRIAMAFTIAALIAEGESMIEGAEAVSVSFPEFFALLESITER